MKKTKKYNQKHVFIVILFLSCFAHTRAVDKGGERSLKERWVAQATTEASPNTTSVSAGPKGLDKKEGIGAFLTLADEPTRPANFTAVATPHQAKSISLSFDQASPPGVHGKGYLILRKEEENANIPTDFIEDRKDPDNFSTVPSGVEIIVIDDNTVTQHIDEDLKDDTFYTYVIIPYEVTNGVYKYNKNGFPKAVGAKTRTPVPVTLETTSEVQGCVIQEEEDYFIELPDITVHEGQKDNFKHGVGQETRQDFVLQLSDASLSFNADQACFNISTDSISSDSVPDIQKGDSTFFIEAKKKHEIEIGFDNENPIGSSAVDVIRISGLRVKLPDENYDEEFNIKISRRDTSYVDFKVNDTIMTVKDLEPAQWLSLNLYVSDNNSVCGDDIIRLWVRGGDAHLEEYEFFYSDSACVLLNGLTRYLYPLPDRVYFRASASDIASLRGKAAIRVRAKSGCYNSPEITLPQYKPMTEVSIQYGSPAEDYRDGDYLPSINSNDEGVILRGKPAGGKFSGEGIKSDGYNYHFYPKKVNPGRVYNIEYEPKQEDYCSEAITVRIYVFDGGNPAQILGINKGGVCRNSGERQVNIGWSEHEKDDKKLISFEGDYIGGSMDSGYDGGSNSGFFIDLDRIQDYVSAFTIKINYELTSNQGQPRKEYQRIEVIDPLEVDALLSDNTSLKNAYCEGDEVILVGTPVGSGGYKKFYTKDRYDYDYDLLKDNDLYFKQQDSGSDTPLQNYLPPNADGKGEYDIRYEYQDAYGCISDTTYQVSVYSPPSMLGEGDMPKSTFCIGDTIKPFKFTTEEGISLHWYNDKRTPIDTTYTFDSGIGTGQSSVTQFLVERVLDTAGCASKERDFKVQVGTYPEPDFDFRDVCFGTSASFRDSSKAVTAVGELSFNKIDTLFWDFGDGGSSYDTIASHKFTGSGTFPVMLKVTTANGCADSLMKYINVFENWVLRDSLSGLQEDFEGENRWIPSAASGRGERSSWFWGSPDTARKVINRAFSGEKAWFTGGEGKEQDTTYNAGEASWVESPCIDLSAIDRPMISLKTWRDTEEGLDGAVIQYYDDGAWKVLGEIGEGVNWYNSRGIISAPGEQDPDEYGNIGWSGKQEEAGWQTTKNRLDKVKKALGDKPTRFRIAFSSNGDNAPGETFDGFAFDDFSISSRDRVVLLEHFTNLNLSGGSNAEWERNFIDDFCDENLGEVLPIYYHMSSPSPDPFNDYNEGDPRARAWHYGVSHLPRTALDGRYDIQTNKIPFSEDWDGKTGEGWGRKSFVSRVLKKVPFILSLELDSVYNDMYQVKRLKVTVTVEKRVPELSIPGNLTLRMAVVQKNARANGKSYHNVFREFLTEGGISIEGDWEGGDGDRKEEFTAYWNPRTQEIFDADLLLVAFVYDNRLIGATKEVYQTVYETIPFKPDLTTVPLGLPDQAVGPSFSLHPNPTADGTFTLRLAVRATGRYRTVVYDSWGRTVHDQAVLPGSLELKFDLRHLAGGLYQVWLRDGQGRATLRKVLLQH